MLFRNFADLEALEFQKSPLDLVFGANTILALIRLSIRRMLSNRLNKRRRFRYFMVMVM